MVGEAARQPLAAVTPLPAVRSLGWCGEWWVAPRSADYNPVGQALWLPLQWSAVYVCVNLIYIVRILRDRIVFLTPVEEVSCTLRLPPGPMAAPSLRRL